MKPNEWTARQVEEFDFVAKRLGVSHDELLRRIGVPKEAMSAYRNGTRNCQVRTFHKLTVLEREHGIGEYHMLAPSARHEEINHKQIVQCLVGLFFKDLSAANLTDKQRHSLQTLQLFVDFVFDNFQPRKNFPSSQPTSPQPNTGSVRCRDEAAAPHGAAVTPFNHQPKETAS